MKARKVSEENEEQARFSVEDWAWHCINTHTNPYRSGDSHDLFSYIQSKQAVTKEECRVFVMENLFKDQTKAEATTDSVLSPRLKSRRGDCRGRVSSDGHIYYMEKLSRPIRLGIREPQRFRLRWREVPLPRKLRNSQMVIEQEKTTPVKGGKKQLKEQLKEKQKEVQAQKKLIKELLKLQRMEVVKH